MLCDSLEMQGSQPKPQRKWSQPRFLTNLLWPWVPVRYSAQILICITKPTLVISLGIPRLHMHWMWPPLVARMTRTRRELLFIRTCSTPLPTVRHAWPVTCRSSAKLECWCSMFLILRDILIPHNGVHVYIWSGQIHQLDIQMFKKTVYGGWLFERRQSSVYKDYNKNKTGIVLVGTNPVKSQCSSSDQWCHPKQLDHCSPKMDVPHIISEGARFSSIGLTQQSIIFSSLLLLEMHKKLHHRGTEKWNQYLSLNKQCVQYEVPPLMHMAPFPPISPILNLAGRHDVYTVIILLTTIYPIYRLWLRT